MAEIFQGETKPLSVKLSQRLRGAQVTKCFFTFFQSYRGVVLVKQLSDFLVPDNVIVTVQLNPEDTIKLIPGVVELQIDLYTAGQHYVTHCKEAKVHEYHRGRIDDGLQG